VPQSSPPPDKLQDFIDAEQTRWGQVVKDAGLAGTVVASELAGGSALILMPRRADGLAENHTGRSANAIADANSQ